MLRNKDSKTPGEDLEGRSRATPGRGGSDDFDEPRMLDLDAEEESPFLRGQKRVPVRRGPLPRKAANRLKIAVVVVVLVGALLGAGALFYKYGTSSWRFRIDSRDNIEIAGLQNVPRSQVLEIMGGDIGRNIFFVPLADRKRQLEEIPWVESATVMRFLPDNLKVEIRERTPVAFVQIGSKIGLIDAGGVVMDLPAGNPQKYSFPVIVGTSASEPRSTRSARMKVYMALVRDLDSTGARYSHELSEVDLSDPEDVKVTVADPDGTVLVHLGASGFLGRYKIFVAHLKDWRAAYPHLESVNLRYDGQVILNQDSKSAAPATVPLPAGKPSASTIAAPARPPRRGR
ncbi:MAG TPA: FtsQ-type POTRA domain-containing protein [Terriglobales bacterium]|jgi:cell division protein FtsQ|nr:FtsQ-type POTRA domain-containing protein [Terriglobales bacterium]